MSASAPLRYRFSHMFVHCANISRSKSKLWSICNSVHVCHLLSAGNPAPQADGGSPYIVLTCIIPHLNIVLTIKFGSFYLLEVFLRLMEVHLTLSIPATFNISHLNIVLTIIFGSFLFAALKPGLLLGSLQKQIAGVLKRQRSVPNSCQRAACHLVW